MRFYVSKLNPNLSLAQIKKLGYKNFSSLKKHYPKARILKLKNKKYC